MTSEGAGAQWQWSHSSMMMDKVSIRPSLVLSVLVQVKEIEMKCFVLAFLFKKKLHFLLYIRMTTVKVSSLNIMELCH